MCPLSVFLNCQNSYADEGDSADVAWEKNHESKLVNPEKLTIAISPDYPPFSYIEDGKVLGFEPDIYNEIANRLGLEVEEKIMNFDAIIAAVASGNQVDLGIAGISIDPDRSKLVDFSDSYYDADISFASKTDGEISRANAKIKMNSSSVRYAVQSGTTGESYVRENFPRSQIITFNNANDCFAAVVADKADVVCSTTAVNTSLIKTTYNNMHTIREVATGEQYGIAINKDNDGLKSRINAVITNMKDDGSMQRIANKVGLNMTGGVVKETMHTVKCTAKTNSMSQNSVLGGTPTRLTYESQAAPDEVISGISLIMPDGTEFSYDNAQVTMLLGDDLLTRAIINTEVSKNGQEISFKFSDLSQIKPGAYYRIEIYDVVFPSKGGEITVKGSYTSVGGQKRVIEDIPSLEITNRTPIRDFAESINESEVVKAWNSNQFCNLFFNPGIFLLSIPIVFDGFLMALAVVACAFPLAIPIGLLLSLLRISRNRFLRGLASVYVNIVRGTPLFLQIYIAFFGLPLAGIKIPSFPLGVIVLGINSSAYLCEIFRGGIQSISNGQYEAARSLGLNRAKAMFYVILPQAIVRCIPTLASEFILLYKDTSLLASVGLMEVVMFAKNIVASTGSITPYIVAALFYLIITLPLAKVVTVIERKVLKSNNVKTKKNNNFSKKNNKNKEEMNIDGLGKNSNGSNKLKSSNWSSA